MNTPVSQVQARNVQTSATPAPEQRELSVSDAARLMAQRRSELRQQQAPTEPAVQTEQVPEEEVFPEEPESPVEPPDDAPETEESTPDGEDQPESEDASLSDDNAVLILDGEEIPLKDVKAWREGAMRTDDYQRKTQALSQSQQAISTMETELNRFAHAMNRKFQQTMSSNAKEMQRFTDVDWGLMAEKNPQMFTAQKAKFEATKTRYEQGMQEWQGFLGEYQDLSERALQMKAAAALPVIKQKIRGWNDGMYADRKDFAIATYGAEKGVINKITDPWFWEMLNDAYTLRKGKAVPKLAAKVVKKSPRATPAPGSAPRRPDQVAKATEQSLAAARASTSTRVQTEEALKILRSRRQQQLNQRNRPQ